jgi:maltose/moltooligosaccharide transporter
LQALDEAPAGADRSPRGESRGAGFAQLWTMCFGLFGVQVVWGLQNVNTSRIFQTLGADVDQLAILWIAAPITGLVVQPLIGHLSDRTWTRLGRRRPYMLAGGVVTAAALVAMANARSLWAASAALWVLSAAVNVAMEPFRALIADNLPGERRTSAFALQVFFIGAGAVFASALPWMLAHGWGMSGVAAADGGQSDAVRAAFAIGAAALLASVGWTVLFTRERPPAAAGPAMTAVPTARGLAVLRNSGLGWLAGGALLGFATALGDVAREFAVLAAIAVAFGILQLVAVALRRSGRTAIGVVGIVEDILHMPVVLRRLAVVQFFTWSGMFALWVYAVPALAARDFGTRDPSSRGYAESADLVGMLFAEYNAVAAVAALLLPAAARAIGRPACHALCLVAGAAGLAGFALVGEAGWLWLPAIGIGVAWAAILSLPYAMLADGVPASRVGTYMGIHNIFIVLPQLLAAAVLGFVVREMFGAATWRALELGAVGLLAGAAASLLLLPADPPPRR